MLKPLAPKCANVYDGAMTTTAPDLLITAAENAGRVAARRVESTYNELLLNLPEMTESRARYIAGSIVARQERDLLDGGR